MVGKRHEGRDEAILDPAIPIIDAHHHLFDRPVARYLLDEYLADVRAGHNVLASVYVETMAFARPSGPEPLRPLGEIEFATGVGAMSDSGFYGPCRVCAGIVGYADLRLGDGVAETLDGAQNIAGDRLKGIRQTTLELPDPSLRQYMTHPPPEGIMQHPGFRKGLGQLARRGLSFDVAVFHNQLPTIAELADAFPDTTFVVNHIGMALRIGKSEAELADVFTVWRKNLQELARRQNVVCKIGGLGVPFWGFGFYDRKDVIGYMELANAWRPYIETGIATFGPKRSMLQSDFPMDGRSCGYVPAWNALKHVVRDHSAAEKADLFYNTANRVYRLGMPDPTASA